jgi:hypothetical protein
MPSEERSRLALAALSRPRAVFHSAVSSAVDELSALLSAQRAPAASRAEHESARLGAFGAGRIDVDRFAGLVSAPASMDAARLARLEEALALLTSFAASGDSLYRIRVQRGVDLRTAVRGALAARGCVFRTAHEVMLLRAGELPGTPVGDASLQFRHWRRAEKAMAPPLVVDVDGTDMYVAGLADFMDGAQKIVLVVDGPMAPAPLARLITPRTFVMQTTDPAALERLGAYDGPGIAALVPEGCALFTHDPARGASLAQRLTVELLPELPLRGVAGGSVRQQSDELAWLGELARTAVLQPALSPDVSEPDAAPADQLAAWLLRLSTQNAQAGS